jgi:endoglycosylceramidase
MKEWGLDAIRLLVLWDALEPERGRYDDAYVARVAAKARQASDAGLFVFLDLHQDVFGPKFSGDGAPDWASAPLTEPFVPKSPWFANYGQPVVAKAFGDLWRDHDLQSHLALGIRRLATATRQIPGVVGFEPLNEPWPGDIEPQAFEEKYLAPFYRTVLAAVREDGDARLFFLEPSLMRSLGTAFPSRLPAMGENVVYAPHFYNLGMDTGGAYAGTLGPVGESIDLAVVEARRVGGPLVVGEMGVQADRVGAADYLRDLGDKLDSVRAGMFLWSWDGGGAPGGPVSTFDWLDAAGEVQLPFRAFLRPYPAAVAGQLVSYAFDPDARRLEVRFDEGGASGETEIAFPRLVWPSAALTVTSSDPAGRWSYTVDSAAGRVRVKADPGSAHHLLTLAPP